MKTCIAVTHRLRNTVNFLRRPCMLTTLVAAGRLLYWQVAIGIQVVSSVMWPTTVLANYYKQVFTLTLRANESNLKTQSLSDFAQNLIPLSGKLSLVMVTFQLSEMTRN